MLIKNLVYLSYGGESEYRRAIFNILSFQAWCPDITNSIRIIIYTDDPDFFENHLLNFEIELYFLSEKLLDEMSGQENFIHRRKVWAIALTFQNYPEQDLVFIDSDTFFVANADMLFCRQNANESFMHVREYELRDGLDIFSSFNQGHFPKALIERIKDKDFNIGNKIMRFTPEDYSWNSGVLGLSSHFARLMPDILQLTDEFYSASKWFLSEQLAFSFVLARLTIIQPTDDLVCHYWGGRQKVLVDHLLSDYLFSNKQRFMNYERIKYTTKLWQKIVHNDIILEQIEIAKASGSWIYLGKKVIRFILFNKLDMSSYHKLWKVIFNY
jgi:hypothetical protein